MSQTATRPWWADVQHLRPDEEGGEDERAFRTGRFDRPTPSTRRPRPDEPTARVSTRASAGDDADRRAAPAPRRRERPEPEDWLDPPAPAPAPKPERRTIEIRGQADRVAGVPPVTPLGPQRRRGRMAHERVGPRPDRVALWAVLLGLLLILVAAISSPGADAAAIAAGWL
jgi:hypothetical protein